MNTTIQTVANQNETAKAIFQSLAERQRFRSQTNLRKLHNTLLNQGKKIVENDFMGTFKKLQELGVGSIIIGRGVTPDRFIWNYNLKEIAKIASQGGNTKELDKLETAPKKQPMVIPRVKRRLAPQEDDQTVITIKLSPNVRKEDIASLISLIKGLEVSK